MGILHLNDEKHLDDEKPLTPEQARLVARVRWLMLISGVAIVLGIAVVIGVIGYRVSRDEGRAADVTATLPKGARIVSTAVSSDRIAVTIEINGVIEIRTFDPKSLKPVGRLRFATEP
jgi:TRAP-type C4-dicarboxylate transport system permease small subunit